MKLAVLTHGFPSYANPVAANFLVPFLGEIVKEGHNIWVLTPMGGADKSLQQPYPVQTFSWGSSKLLGQLKLWNPLDSFALARFLKVQRATLLEMDSLIGFDHVLVVWLVPNAIAARTLMRKEGVPYSTWSLGTDINKYAGNYLTRGILRGLLKDAAYNFANSHKLCERITEISGQKAEMLPTYRPLGDPPKELIPPLDRRAFHFLCVARLEPVKGQDILIEAFTKLYRQAIDKDIYLHLLGDGSMHKKLEDRVRQAGIEENVHFYGMVESIKVAGFLKVVDCMVLPSRNESMPVAFWEAQASGIPVIGTDVGDLGWAIREFGQGLVVEAEDIDGLALAMKQAVEKGGKILKPNHNAAPPDPKKTAKKFLEVLGA